MALVSKEWLSGAASAIAKKNGSQLSTCMNQTREENFFGSSSHESLRLEEKGQLQTVVDSVRSELFILLKQQPPGPEHDDQLNALYAEFMVRLVAASATYRMHLGPAKHPPKAIVSTAYNKLVQGLLHSFDLFQDLHLRDRSHYSSIRNPPRHSTAGTTGWDTVPLITLVHMIQSAAHHATSVNEEALNELVRNWRRMYITLLTTDKGVQSEFSRRRGALAVVNGLLIMLFQHNNTHQCRVLLSAVEQNEKSAETSGDFSKSVLNPASHMIAEVVKFFYYQGRMKLYERKYNDAFGCFLKAYRQTPQLHLCSPQQHKNKLRILFFLMTSGVSCGLMPPEEILSVDPFIRHIFQPLLQSIQDGDHVAFSRAVDKNDEVLRKRGVFMMLHQARILCFLYLLKRVHAALVASTGQGSQIPVSLLVEASNILQRSHGKSSVTDAVASKKHRIEAQTLDEDAMSLWMARLISRKFVRGYISYEHRTLVISKKEPFVQPGAQFPGNSSK
jgi:hypothetical protein